MSALRAASRGASLTAAAPSCTAIARVLLVPFRSQAVATAQQRSHATTLPVVNKQTGMRIGSCDAQMTEDQLLERLKYIPTARKLFMFPQIGIETTSEKILVDVPLLKKPIPVSVLRAIDTDLFKLTSCSSVTTEGKLLFTEAFADGPPPVRLPVSDAINELLKHQSLSYLEGLELQLAGMIKGKWTIIKDKIPDEEITELGLVVPDNSVRVVELEFGESLVETVLRSRPGKSLLENLKADCDWHAWPAVSACTEDVTLGEDNVIEMKGELLCRVSRLGDSLVAQACTGSSGPHSRIS
jgi:hypothetical protein